MNILGRKKAYRPEFFVGSSEFFTEKKMGICGLFRLFLQRREWESFVVCMDAQRAYEKAH